MLVSVTIFILFTCLLFDSTYSNEQPRKKLTTDSDLLKAAGNGEVDKVKDLIQNHQANVEARNNYGVR
jgi:hypothetical protein